MTESIERSERILVKYPLFKTAIARVQACFDSHESTAEPDCCPIVGVKREDYDHFVFRRFASAC